MERSQRAAYRNDFETRDAIHASRSLFSLLNISLRRLEFVLGNHTTIVNACLHSSKKIQNTWKQDDLFKIFPPPYSPGPFILLLIELIGVLSFQSPKASRERHHVLASHNYIFASGHLVL